MIAHSSHPHVYVLTVVYSITIYTLEDLYYYMHMHDDLKQFVIRIHSECGYSGDFTIYRSLKKSPQSLCLDSEQQLSSNKYT